MKEATDATTADHQGAVQQFTPADDIEKFNGRSAPEVPAVQQDGFLAVVERLASRPDIDPDKIQKFMDMQERILDRNEQKEFNAAMTRAQNKIELVVAKSYNTQTESNYAKLKEVLIAAKPIYTKEGFSLMFYEGDSPKDEKKRICADIMHSAGHTEKRHVDLTVTTKGTGGTTFMTQIHGEGSAFSYGRRYLTCMIFNIPTGDDDDGNSAGDLKKDKATGPPINTDQQNEITEKLKYLYKDNGEKFLAGLKIGSVEEIPAKRYQEIKNAIEIAETLKEKAGNNA